MVSIFHSFRRAGQMGLPHKSSVFVGLTCVWAIGFMQAQAQPVPETWQLSAGWQDYREAQMQLTGPELGLHWQSQGLGHFRAEADVLLGLQNYSSPESGRLNRVPNLDTRWRLFKTAQSQPQWQYGLALHTHFNHFRGTTSLGFGGYDRLSKQIWLPVRWQFQGWQPWSLDAGWLLWGEHMSRLSQVHSRYQDVTHAQRKGAYLQASTHIQTSQGQWQPYARWTWVGESDVRAVTVLGESRGTFEPRSNRLQLGVKWLVR